jgi:Na+-transporting NADH:ubiquinone oxidoreductase subunit NqrB
MEKKSMKKLLMIFACAALLVVVAAGCVAPEPMGVIYTDIKRPELMSQDATHKKVGKSQSESWLNLVALGDSSIQKAIENGKIKKINHIDREIKSEIPLGIKTVYITTVYGE